MRKLTLERYDVGEELGRGGMSVVYRARDRRLGRDVAVKILHESLAGQPEAKARFRREATAIARLHHPGIVEVFDFSDLDDDPAFLVTEFVDGLTLRAFVDRYGQPSYPELALLVVSQIVPALVHAHEKAVIHRDLKPENIMVTQTGQVKLMDFGLAQILSSDTRITLAGTILGSPAHMAPEIIDGLPADARADIFSLGTVLYWLATGLLPFRAENASALFRKILEGRYEAPQAIEPRIGNRLARIIERCLMSDREARYPTASMLGADIEAELEAVDLRPSEPHARQYLSAPRDFKEAYEPRLIAALLAAGKKALSNGDLARSADRLNRALAVRPDDPEARALFARVRGRDSARSWIRRVFLGAALAAGIAGGWALFSADSQHPTKAEDIEAPGMPESEDTRPESKQKSAEATSIEDLTQPKVAPPDSTAPDSTPPDSTVPAPSSPSTRGNGQSDSQNARGTTSVRTRPARSESAQDDASTSTAQPPSAGAEAEREIRAELHIRVGNAWAEIYIDGELRAKEHYSGSFAMSPGRHTIDIVKPGNGRYRTRIILVSEDGRLFEITGGEQRPIPPFGLEVVIPRPDALRIPEGWVRS